MDLNYLFSRHQLSLVAADTAACRASRSAHRGLARGYAERIRVFQKASGATARLASPA